MTLSQEQQIEQHERTMNAIVERLLEKYKGILSKETISRVAYESYAGLKRSATNKVSYPITEKFASDRLRALGIAQDPSSKTMPEVLFVCVQNAGRSQMAMGLLKALSNGRVNVMSAGSAPASEVSEKTVSVMGELGIDVSEAFPKPLTDDVVRAADVVITMGCGDACAIYPGKRYLDWELEDPAHLDLDGVRGVRDEIRSKVLTLISELGLES